MYVHAAQVHRLPPTGAALCVAVAADADVVAAALCVAVDDGGGADGGSRWS